MGAFAGGDEDVEAYGGERAGGRGDVARTRAGDSVFAGAAVCARGGDGDDGECENASDGGCGGNAGGHMGWTGGDDGGDEEESRGVGFERR